MSIVNPKLLAYLLLVSTFFVASVVQAKPIEIRFSHVVSEDSPKGKMALRFKELVSQRIGDDRVVVRIYPNSELFSDSAVVDELLAGNVELAAPSLSKVKKFAKRFQVFDLPFVFSSSIAAEKFVQGEYGVRLLRTLGRKGLHGLGYLTNGTRHLSSNKKMLSPADLDGLTFRYSGSDVAKTWLQSVGVTPKKISFSKVYNALEVGEIDGQMNAWSNIFSKRFHEHQKFIAETGHSYIGYVIMSSQKFWQGMPDDIRLQLEDAMRDALDYGNQVAREKVIADRQAIIDAGTSEVYKLSADQRQMWTEAMLPVWKRFEDEIGAELIQAAASQR